MMATFSLIALAVALAAAAVALCSSHIPWLRTLTGAAPHQPDEAADFAASRAAGYVESPDDWAARVEAGLAAAPMKTVEDRGTSGRPPTVTVRLPDEDVTHRSGEPLPRVGETS